MVQTQVGHKLQVGYRKAQGSVLWPLLFLLFINDMPDDIMSSIKIFADDTKVYKDVQTEEDMMTLQKDVYALCDWSLK